MHLGWFNFLRYSMIPSLLDYNLFYILDLTLWGIEELFSHRNLWTIWRQGATNDWMLSMHIVYSSGFHTHWAKFSSSNLFLTLLLSQVKNMMEMEELLVLILTSSYFELVAFISPSTPDSKSSQESSATETLWKQQNPSSQKNSLIWMFYFPLFPSQTWGWFEGELSTLEAPTGWLGFSNFNIRF